MKLLENLVRLVNHQRDVSFLSSLRVDVESQRQVLAYRFDRDKFTEQSRTMLQKEHGGFPLALASINISAFLTQLVQKNGGQ